MSNQCAVNRLNIIQPIVSANTSAIESLQEQINQLQDSNQRTLTLTNRLSRQQELRNQRNFLLGPQGPQGPPGEQGVTGATGDKGEAGLGSPTELFPARESMKEGSLVILENGKMEPLRSSLAPIEESRISLPHFSSLLTIQSNQVVYGCEEEGTIGLLSFEGGLRKRYSRKLEQKIDPGSMSFAFSPGYQQVMVLYSSQGVSYVRQYQLSGFSLDVLGERKFAHKKKILSRKLLFDQISKHFLFFFCDVTKKSFYSQLTFKKKMISYPIYPWGKTLKNCLSVSFHFNQMLLTYCDQTNKKMLTSLATLDAKTGKLSFSEELVLRSSVGEIQRSATYYLNRTHALIFHSNNLYPEKGYGYCHVVKVMKPHLQHERVFYWHQPKRIQATETFFSSAKHPTQNSYLVTIAQKKSNRFVQQLYLLLAYKNNQLEVTHSTTFPGTPATISNLVAIGNCFYGSTRFHRQGDKFQSFSLHPRKEKVHQLLGILQENVFAGKEARVRICSSVDHSLGKRIDLLPGRKYYVHENGKVDTVPTLYELGLALSKERFLFRPKYKAQ